MDDKYKKLFWNKVKKTSNCWIWQGGISSRGYGNFGIRKNNILKNYRAHRFAYADIKGKIPIGKMICHHCDNPLCVNPSHLFLGDARTNAIDMVKKGRANPPRGERAGNSKLEISDILKIRQMAKNGISIIAISRLFPVCRQQISRIISGLRWVHIN